MIKKKGFVPKVPLLEEDGTQTAIFHSKHTYLVKKFLKKDSDVNWANEIRIANILFKYNSSMDFWEFFELDFKLNSLAFFLTEKGKLLVKKGENNFKFSNVQKTDTKIEKKKVGEDKNINPQKPKTLFDFIKR